MLAVMAHRNTNDPEKKMSPAKVIYGRRLTHAFKFMTRTDKFSDEAVQPACRQAWELKERANRHRFFSQREQTSKTVGPLPLGAKVFIQNQHGAQQVAWDRTGTVTDTAYALMVSEEYPNVQDNTCVNSFCTTTEQPETQNGPSAPTKDPQNPTELIQAQVATPQATPDRTHRRLERTKKRMACEPPPLLARSGELV